MQSAEHTFAPVAHHRFLELLRKVELAVAAISVIALVLTSLAIILLRMFASTSWSVGAVDTLSQYPSHLMLVAALLGGSLALTRGETLRIEVLNNFLSPANHRRVARAVVIVGVLFFLVFVALIVRYLMIDYRPVVAFVYLPLMALIALKLVVLGFTAK